MRKMRGWLTSINPLIKVLATLPPLILVFFTRDILTPAIIASVAVIILLTGLRIRLRTVLFGALVIIVVGVWTTFLFAVLVRSELVADSPLILDGWLTLHADALPIGGATALRLITVSMLALLGSAGTTIAGLSSALVNQLHLPYRFTHGVLTAARFAPRYRDDLRTLRAAHRARGIIDPRGPIGFFRRTGRSTLPLLAGGARYAERLSLAMDARGFGAYSARSDRHPARVAARDWTFLLCVWSLFAAIFISAALLGISRWSGDIYGFM